MTPDPPRAPWDAPMAPTPPPTSTPRGSRLGLGIAVGVALGLVVGGVGGFAAGWWAGSPGSLSVGGIDIGSGDSAGESFSYEAAAPPEPSSTREEPVPLGTAVDVGNGWRVVVTSFVADANAAVAAAGTFNEPPAAGKQYVLVGLEATYVEGEKDSVSPFFGLDLSLLGSAGVARTEGDANCQGPEPRFENLTDLFEGGTAAGSMCVAVGVEEVGSLVLVVEPGLSFDSVKSYMALR